MRIFLVWLLLAVVAVAGPAAGRLEALKKEFPRHVVGPMTDRTHPEISQCFERYHLAVERITPDTLAKAVVDLRERIWLDLIDYDRIASDSRNALGPTGRAAARQNASWLRQRVTPFLRRLASLQLGR